ncbi:MAG TPA: hypothetical protein VIW45_02615 [Vicinamibacterales bacterium]
MLNGDKGPSSLAYRMGAHASVGIGVCMDKVADLVTTRSASPPVRRSTPSCWPPRVTSASATVVGSVSPRSSPTGRTISSTRKAIFGR